RFGKFAQRRMAQYWCCPGADLVPPALGPVRFRVDLAIRNAGREERGEDVRPGDRRADRRAIPVVKPALEPADRTLAELAATPDDDAPLRHRQRGQYGSPGQTL